MNTPLTNLFESNSRIARGIRAVFAMNGVTAVSLVGPAGAGKTTVIETLARKLRESVRVAAIIGNPAASRDVELLHQAGIQAVGVRTDNLTARDVGDAMTTLDLKGIDFLFIESSGNTLSPVEYDLGQKLRVAVFSAAGGDDKAVEYARLVAESDIVLLTKVDLLPFVDFDLNVFTSDVRRIDRDLTVMQFSGRIGTGADACVGWLASQWSAEDQARLRIARENAGPLHGGKVQ